MKNEPLDYFKSKKEPPHTLKSYRKLVLAVKLLIGLVLMILLLQWGSPDRFSLFLPFLFVLLILILAIPLLSFSGIINILNSYRNREEDTTKRTITLIFHVLVLVIYTCLVYFTFNLIPLS